MKHETVLEFTKFLKECQQTITAYDPSKKFSVSINHSPKTTTAKFLATLQAASATVDPLKYVEVRRALMSINAFSTFLLDYCAAEGFFEDGDDSEDNPYKHLALYRDPGSRDATLYTVHRETKRISPITGKAYVDASGKSYKACHAMAQNAFIEYAPRKPMGEFTVTVDGEPHSVINSYRPPEWFSDDLEVSPKTNPPKLIKKLIDHLIPSETEKEFLYSWLYHAQFKRAYTFLVLCGAPGIGKNILKKVVRALHGHSNTVDGKRTAFSTKFNSQLQECTLVWCDELRYDAEMENSMKEVQNDTISIEGKGVDATRGTRLYASIVIVNNKPRDNYLDFEARKFSPLQLTPHRLETSMTPKEISKLVDSVEDPESPDYDPSILAEFSAWLKENGKSEKWPTLEYRGPMFYRLAHTSMTRWQKKTIQLLIEFTGKVSNSIETIPELGMRWSTILAVEEARKGGANKMVSFPSHSSVSSFLDSFLDGLGRHCFDTADYTGSMNIDEDFYVKCVVDEIRIHNPIDLKTRLTAGEKDAKTTFDLGGSEQPRTSPEQKRQPQKKAFAPKKVSTEIVAQPKRSRRPSRKSKSTPRTEKEDYLDL